MEAIIQRSTDQIACDMGGEMVVLDLKSGFYYGLDALGVRIWSLIEQPASLASVRDAILAEYDVSFAQCEQDLAAFIAKMQAAGLVEVSDAALR